MEPLKLTESDSDAVEAIDEVNAYLAKEGAGGLTYLASSTKSSQILHAIAHMVWTLTPEHKWTETILPYLIDNPVTEPGTLELLAKAIDRHNNRFEDYEYDDSYGRESFHQLLLIISRPQWNRDSGYFANHPRWDLRYATALTASQKVLRLLVDDQNYAVRTLAKRKMGMKPDEALALPMSSEQCNQEYGEIRKSLLSAKPRTALLRERIEGKEYTGFDYFDSFNDDCVEALKKLRERIVSHLTIKLQTEYLPNVTAEYHHILQAIELFDVIEKGYFDVNIIVSEIEKNMPHSAAISLDEIRRKARSLIPRGYDEKHNWGPIQDANEIVEGNKLKLCAFWEDGTRTTAVRLSRESDDGVKALDKLGHIVLENADPTVVASTITWFGVGRKHTPCGTSMKTIRGYKNSHFEVEYADETQARQIAEALLRKEKARTGQEEGTSE